jgi:endonuclease/exonuclease/phosphatase family metal-dependent hydrolase
MKKKYRVIFIVFLSLILVFALAVMYAKSPVRTKSYFFNNEIVTFGRTITPPINEFRIVTYNIGYAYAEQNNLSTIPQDQVMKNLDAAVEALKAMSPDIICLQEIDFDSSRTYHIDQLQYLADKLGFAQGAYAVNWNKRYLPFPYWPPKNHFGQMVSGQAILSRFPLSEHSLTVFEKPPNAFWYNWFYLERVAQKVIVKLGDETQLALWNVHLEAFDVNTRVKQAKKLAELVNNDPHDFKVVVGDFNDPQVTVKANTDNGVFQFIASTKMQSDYELSDEFTFPSWKPVEKLDHIFFSRQLALDEFGVIQTLASDHLPVWADIVY